MQRKRNISYDSVFVSLDNYWQCNDSGIFLLFDVELILNYWTTVNYYWLFSEQIMKTERDVAKKCFFVVVVFHIWLKQLSIEYLTNLLDSFIYNRTSYLVGFLWICVQKS